MPYDLSDDPHHKERNEPLPEIKIWTESRETRSLIYMNVVQLVTSTAHLWEKIASALVEGLNGKPNN